MAGTGTDPMERLKDVSQELLGTLSTRAVDMLSHSMDGLTDKLEDVGSGGPLKGLLGGAAKSAAEGGGAGGAVKGAVGGLVGGVKDKLTGGGGKSSGGGKPTKATKIIEEIDVGVPIDVAYNQWTEFDRFPQFMRKVEKAEAAEDTTINWKAQIFWSHRSWEATILEQVPDERIVWRSKGEKGHVDGAVTFHELGPNLTRIIVALEYYPQGLFERTGNIWRAQGRRVRAELQQYRRHVMTRTILDPDELEGWRGEIRDGEVVRSHEDVVAEEQDEDQPDESDEQDEQDESEDDYDEGDEPEDEYDEGESDENEPDENEPDEGDEPEPGDDDQAEDEPQDEESEPEPDDEPEAEDDEEPDEDYDEEPEPEDDYDEPEEPQDEESDEAPEDEPADDYDEEPEPDDEPEPEPEAPRRRARRAR
jgi:uncharacterized membrane protein